MAEETVTGPAAESSTSNDSAPIDTASIAADVIKESEGGVSQSAVEAEAAADAAAEAKAQAEGVDPDDFSLVPERDPSGRVNRIPHTRVSKMVKKAEQRVIASLAKELGISKAEAELKLEDLTGAITERGTKLTGYESRLAELDAIGKIMDEDADRFIEILAQANPRYQKFLKQQAAEAKAAETPAEAQRPAPDYDLGDGRKTYSDKGLEARIAYDVNQAVTAALAKQKAEFEKEFGPIKKKHEADTVAASVNQKVEAALAKAQTWPGWKENEKEIYEAFSADKSLSLYDAYVKVVPQRFKSEAEKAKADEKTIEARVREQVLKELNAAPTSTSTSPSKAVGLKKDNEVRDTADVAREVMRELEKA
jgi:hypothetical protein